MRRFHWHSDRSWRIVGALSYHECRCGARKVRRAFANIMSPVAVGWPRLIDAHGRALFDTGWHRRPAEGWPIQGLPDEPAYDVRMRPREGHTL